MNNIEILTIAATIFMGFGLFLPILKKDEKKLPQILLICAVICGISSFLINKILLNENQDKAYYDFMALAGVIIGIISFIIWLFRKAK